MLDMKPWASKSFRHVHLTPARDQHDGALWTDGDRPAAWRATALVGMFRIKDAQEPDAVARALLDCHDLGMTTFLIRGYDPLDCGRELISVIRAVIARRDGAEPVLAVISCTNGEMCVPSPFRVAARRCFIFTGGYSRDMDLF
jgi:hypothetical protein